MAALARIYPTCGQAVVKRNKRGREKMENFARAYQSDAIISQKVGVTLKDTTKVYGMVSQYTNSTSSPGKRQRTYVTAKSNAMLGGLSEKNVLREGPSEAESNLEEKMGA